MNELEALDVVREWVAIEYPHAEYVIDDLLTEQYEEGWVFHLSTPRALETRDLMDSLAGASPLLVDELGTVEVLETARTVREQLQERRSGAVDADVARRHARSLLLQTLAGLGDARQGEDHGLLAEVTAALRQSYLDLLSSVEISRCPITGEIVNLTFDVDGIDGVWWSAVDPLQPVVALPSTVVAITGSVWRISEESGGLPRVHTQLIESDGVIGVLTSLPIGQHIGFIVVYFSETVPDVDVDELDWGAPWLEHAPIGFDQDIEPWIATGKLRWIHPLDESMTVRTGADGCPFLSE